MGAIVVKLRPEANVAHMMKDGLDNLVVNVVFDNDRLGIGQTNRHLANILRINGQRRPSVDAVFLQSRKACTQVAFFKNPNTNAASMRKTHGLPVQRSPVTIQADVCHALFPIIAADPFRPLIKRPRVIERLSVQSPQHQIAAAEIDLIHTSPFLHQSFRQMPEKMTLRSLKK